MSSKHEKRERGLNMKRNEKTIKASYDENMQKEDRKRKRERQRENDRKNDMRKSQRKKTSRKEGYCNKRGN